jgi:DNA repair exonuclease SbcCD nuclease subunit
MRRDRLLLFSDLHLREESAEVCFAVLAAIRGEAVKRGISSVAFLGDLWHVRYAVPVRLLNALKDELARWGGVGLRLFCLPGNHDQVDVAGRNALEILDALPHVTVISAPVVDAWGLWIPYRSDPAEVERAIELGRMLKAEVVFAHLPIKGALMNSLRANTDGLDSEMFAGFRKVILGHYHKRQAIGRCQYIGSPWQTRADEAGQPKGFAIWDGESLEFHDRDWGPKYRRVTVERGASVDLEVGPSDRLRVSVADESEAARVAAELAERGVTGAIVEPAAVAGAQPRLALGAGASFREYARAYVEAEHGDLEPAALLRAFEELTNER